MDSKDLNSAGIPISSIPALSAEELATLMEDITQDGSRKTISEWRNQRLSGSERYLIASRGTTGAINGTREGC